MGNQVSSIAKKGELNKRHSAADPRRFWSGGVSGNGGYQINLTTRRRIAERRIQITQILGKTARRYQDSLAAAAEDPRL